MDIVAARYDKAGLSDGPDGEAQRVNDTPGLAELIGDFIAKNRVPELFENEEVDSNYRYPEEYTGPRPIEEQIKSITEMFGLDGTSALEYAKRLPALPQGAEGWFTVPSVDALARKHFPEVTDAGEKYCRAVSLIFGKIAASRPFHNWRESQITPKYLRLTARTAEALAKLSEMQKGDILIIATQPGMRHRGRSTRRARAVFMPNEFGLGSLAGGAIALTHPERFVRFEELDMDLPGDEFDNPDADVRFGHAPFLYWFDGRLRFGTDRCAGASGRYGSASAFLPQVNLGS